MADAPLQQGKILKIAIQYLRSLNKNQAGRIVLTKFPPTPLPSGITSTLIQNFLFNVAQTASLEELFEKKEEIVGLLEKLGQKPPPTTTVVAPKEQVIVRPEEDQRGEKRIKVTGLEDAQEILANLTQQIEKLRKTPLPETRKREEKVVYREKERILTDTEKEVEEVILAIEKELNQRLKKAIPKFPQLKRRLKSPEDVSQVSHDASRAVRKELGTLTERTQAVNAAQKVIQRVTGLSRDDAYDLANVIGPDIKSTASRHQAAQSIQFNLDLQQLTESTTSSLGQAGLTSPQVAKVTSLISPAIDSLLEAKDFPQKTPEEALRTVEALVRPALSKNGLSSRNVDLASRALASSEITRSLQKLAESSFRWHALPKEVQQIAFQKTVPVEGEKAVIEIKRYIIQYSLGDKASKIEEAKAEKVAAETTKAVAKKRAEIIARAKQRGLRARVPPEQILKEELPQTLKETVAETLNPKEYGSEFVQQVQESLQRELPPSLLASVQEVIETPPVQLAPAEKEKAAATVEKFIAQELLPGKASPKEETSIEEIARTTVEEIEKEIQASPVPIERPGQIREVTLKSLSRSLEQHQKEYPSLVQKIEKGVTAARAAEKLPSFLSENIQETIQTLPPKLLPWAEKAIAELEEKGILSPESAATYRKRIAQRREEIEAFLSPITPPGIVSRISEKALASNLLSTKKTKEERKQLSERARFLLEQAEKIAPKNRIGRSFLDRLFRLLTGEKDPSQTLESLARSGPAEMKFPNQFRQEIFRRFLNRFFQKSKWRQLDKSTGKSRSRFGRENLKKAFSRLFSPIKKRLARGIKTALKKAGRLLGKIIRPILSSVLKNLVVPALKALTGLLGKLIPLLAGFLAQAATWLAGLASTIATTVGLPVTLIVLLAILIIVILVLTFQAFLLPGAFVEHDLTAGYGSCGLVDPTMASTTLVGIFQMAGGTFKVPPAVVAGVANMEGRHLWNYNDIQIIIYSEEGDQDPKNCSPNECGARGPMQFLTGEGVNAAKCPQAVGVDVWSKYKDAINEFAGEEDRIPHVCNVKDAIFAAAKKLKGNSQTTPENDCQWNQEEVYKAARGYYGACEYSVPVGGKIISGNYCEQVWQYYINSSTEPIPYP